MLFHDISNWSAFNKILREENRCSMAVSFEIYQVNCLNCCPIGFYYWLTNIGPERGIMIQLNLMTCFSVKLVNYETTLHT